MNNSPERSPRRTIEQIEKDGLKNFECFKYFNEKLRKI